MTAPLFLVEPGRLGPGVERLTLDGPEGRHAADVQRLTVGEEVLLADGTGMVARCRVAAAHRGALDLEVLERREETEPALRLVLVQALAKDGRDLMAVEAATELDVDEVVPWQADRSIVRWKGDRADKSHRRWEQAAVAATKQSRRARVPVVAPLAGRADLLERVRSAALTLVLHEDATEPLVAHVDRLPEAGDLLLVVGPEGGVSPEELAGLVEAGAHPVRLGRTVLRTSTAGAAALAVIDARIRWV